MFGDQLLLFFHPLGSADSRADVADPREISEGPFLIENRRRGDISGPRLFRLDLFGGTCPRRARKCARDDQDRNSQNVKTHSAAPDVTKWSISITCRKS